MGQHSNDHSLLATKLAIPPVRSGLIPRSHLFERLEACLQHHLTLLTAPAGFGKTMLLSAWARPRQRSVGWVSLDSSDNDPAQFWTYVLLHLLQSAQPASIETVLAVLINALGTLQQHIALILDDYHVIEELPIHRTVTFLLDHLPLQFPLVLASRVDPPLPLVRLHARYQLVELRADDLRFIFAEAASFLNEIMGFQLAEHGSASESSARAFGAQPD